MTLTAEEIAQRAAELGFRADSLEKVLRLISLLETLKTSSYLRSRVALKGGTALNLFLFDIPRLSVDIDLNYVGSGDRDVMLAERPKVERAIQAACEQEGLVVKRVPADHAGGKWRLSYVSTAGTNEKLEVDLNFMLRVPLWPIAERDSRPLGSSVATQIGVLELHELAAGKLAALCARRASRDMFDARELLRRDDLDRERLRLAFVVYGGINRIDWRTVSVDAIDIELPELERELLPMLRAASRPAASDVAAWAEQLVRETRELMAAVLPLADNEREFIERLNDRGEIVPDLLTSDGELQARLATHPGLRWKAQNVREHAGKRPGA